MDGGGKPTSFCGGGFFVRRWQVIVALALAALAIAVVGLLSALFAPVLLSTIFGGRSGSAVDELVLPLVPPPLPYVRLPRSVVPLHYDVELRPKLEPDFSFTGRVRVRVRCDEATDNVTLHVRGMTWTSTRLQGKEVPAEEDKLHQFLVLRPTDNLVAGQEYDVEVDFAGRLTDRQAGIYRSSYEDPKGERRWLAATQFLPAEARRAFPCFDEPALKATFNISIERPHNMTSISNMPLRHTAELGYGWVTDSGWVRDNFETTLPMSTYLLAFIVSDFKRNGNDKFAVWSREEVIETTSYALEVGPKILEFFESFFKVKYPLPKMDMVAIPDFIERSMENWGVITCRETALLYDPRYSSASNKLLVAMVISHELAHQWFGNLVTPSWWDDQWLNGGFASYVEYLGVEAVHPEWQMERQFVLHVLHDVMELDCQRTSHPISVPVGHPDEINEIFDMITYGKGASIIRMLKHFLGEDNFRNGLMNYLNARKFNSSVQDDLWEHLTKVQSRGSGGDEVIDVKRVMDSWTLQTGYPVVSVIRNYTSGTATVTQNRFLLDSMAPEDTESAWEVPFTYTDGLNPDWTPNTKMWLHKTNGTLKGLPSEWIVANVQEVGCYRVNYDHRNWQLLIQQLDTDHEKIHPVNRAQIIDDALDLARAGQLPYHLSLNATRYLKKEDDYFPWKAALHGFDFIESMICRSAIYGTWMEYVTEQLKPTYEALGWNESPGENILQQYKRVSTLGYLCGYDYPDCVTKAQEKFREWRKAPDNTDIISPILRGVVYCTAVKHGGQDVWDFLWSRYKKEQVASEKAKFMSALACAKEPWLLTRYLNWSLSSDGASVFGRWDGASVFGSVSEKLYGRDLTFNYLRDKWDKIFERYGKWFFSISSLVESLANSFNTPFELQQLREFYANHSANIGQAKRTFEQSLETVEANVRWMDANYDGLVSWLHHQQQKRK